MIKNILLVPNEIKQHFKDKDVFSALMQLTGKVFRDVRGRKTMQFNLGTNSYFIKQHFGVGWAEIAKNLFSFKKPILGAMTEVKAIQKLNTINIATTPLVAYGQRGCNPARQQSFVITEDLGEIISLADLGLDWKKIPPNAAFKRRLIIAVADVAKKLHQNGLNHRDFYICHLCLDTNDLNTQALMQSPIKLYLIDLHRMLIHQKTSVNDNMKDIAALYFSTMDIGLTPRDYLRFKRYYSNGLISSGLSYSTPDFWRKVENRAAKLYAKFHSDKFQQRLSAEKSALL